MRPPMHRHRSGWNIFLVRSVILVMCLVTGRLHAQNASEGWRTMLLERAAPPESPTLSPEQRHAAYQAAIAEIDELAGAERGLPAADRAVADSVIMELFMADGYAHLRENHPSQAVVSYRKALERASLTPTLATRRMQLINTLSNAQRKAGDPRAALLTLDDALRGAGTENDTSAIRNILRLKAIVCMDLRDYRQAIAINTDILALDKAQHDERQQTATELNLSRAYEKIGAEDAFRHANEAYTLAERTGIDRDLLDACELLSRSYQTTSENERCQKLIEHALDKAQERGNAVDIARFHDRFGRFYSNQQRYDEAKQQYLFGLSALEATTSAETGTAGASPIALRKAELQLDLGVCYRALHDSEKALSYLQACETSVTESRDSSVAPWADLGELYLETGDVKGAADNGRRALELGQARRDTAMLHRASGVLYNVYKRQGNAAQALAMHELYMTTASSLKQEKYAMDLQKAQLQFDHQQEQFTDSLAFQRKEVEMDVERGILKQKTRYLITGGIALFLGAALVAFIDRKRRLARFDKEAAQLETQALRSQMNPHFIFNALNSINAFVQKNEPDKAASFLSRFARLMRLVLENSRQSEVPLKDDLEALDAYLHLERARSGEKFDYTIKVDPDIDPEDVLVPPLVAQPFVENAIWHGMSGKTEKGHITLSVSRKGDQLVFSIEDDGVGRHAPAKPVPDASDGAGGYITKKTSLGTAITKARLDLVRQQKGKAAGFTYIDLPQGTRVELTLPFSSAA